MSQDIIRSVEKAHMKADLPKLSVGDTVDVHVRIIEGSKERVQVFNGVIMKMQGSGISASIAVRRIVANEGVERIFPLHSPKVGKIEVVRQGHVRRARLYYLRDRVGKKRRLRDRRRGLGEQKLSTRAAKKLAAAEAKTAPVAAAEPEVVATADA